MTDTRCRPMIKEAAVAVSDSRNWSMHHDAQICQRGFSQIEGSSSVEAELECAHNSNDDEAESVAFYKLSQSTHANARFEFKTDK